MRKTSKTICFISAGLAGGGMERALTGLANHFAGLGHDVCIVNLFKTEQFFELAERINVVWPTAERKNMHRLLYALIIIPYLRKSIRYHMPDVLLSFGEWFNPYVILATRFMGIPLYISDRMGPELSIGPLLETSKKLVYRFASGIIAQTNIAASIIQKKTGAKNIKVIPNPVHVINTDISLKKKQIVTVGRLSREKGHIILIRAFAAMEQNDWYLHIVGDGKERPSLENEVRKFGIQERVIFHGQIKNFHQILGESSIFVLPSFYEGFPNALLEAMSVPLACISSDCIAGPGDIIQNGKNGILVATGDVNKLIEALNLLTTDSILREQLASEAIKVREIYNFETIANHYLNFLFL